MRNEIMASAILDVYLGGSRHKVGDYLNAVCLSIYYEIYKISLFIGIYSCCSFEDLSSYCI